ncbi:MAG: VWA domain-containing protein, partial [Labilithrix sp.]|nr:VWA domain-containing protein [Labilithrix sp.]
DALGGASTGAPPPPALYEAADEDARTMVNRLARDVAFDGEAEGGALRREAQGGDPVLAVLARQAATGLWEEPGRDAVSATVDALLALLRLGLSTAHAVHGAQIKKAVDALLAHLATATVTGRVRELALGVAWLMASGRRTRHAIEDAARVGGADLAALAATLGDEPAVRARVDLLSPTV